MLVATKSCIVKEPAEVSGKIGRELVLLLGARRALLMQIAHPLIAQAVKHHSSFRAAPLKRLLSTLDFTFTMTFGNEQQEKRWIDQLNQTHELVKGVTDDRQLKLGSIYSARDPKLLLWVHATLIQTAIIVYETFVRTLTQEEKNSYLCESASWAILLGIPEAMFPSCYTDLERYIVMTLKSDDLRVTAETLTLTKSILYPYPLLPHWLYRPLNLNLVTTALLPAELRRQYGFVYGPVHSAVFEAFAVATRMIIARTPRILRDNPLAYEWCRATLVRVL